VNPEMGVTNKRSNKRSNLGRKQLGAGAERQKEKEKRRVGGGDCMTTAAHHCSSSDAHEGIKQPICALT
jgi:hypothetical protein